MPKAYRRPEAPASREQELRRCVQSLLNKVCPENVTTIAARITEVEVTSAEELQLVISLIIKKAHTESHYCETYADLVYRLKGKLPEFPAPDGGKPVSFKTALLNCCQHEFESMMRPAPEPQSDARADFQEMELRRQQRKAQTLANMKFIGHLFLRQLLTARIIGSVIQDLVMCGPGDVLPGEHVVECVCELLNSIGHTLESMPAGQSALQHVCGRLIDLKQRTDARGRLAYCKRIQFQIQDLLETRAAGWTKKVFKSAAKTREEIRSEQTRDLRAQARGRTVEGSEQIVAGARPACLSDTSGAKEGSTASQR